MSKHNFIESSERYEYHRIIFCEWCGLVVWHFNYRDMSKTELQAKVGQPCVHPVEKPDDE